MDAYLNAIGTAVPPNDVHRAFVEVVPGFLSCDRQRSAFEKMARRSDIEHRFSTLSPAPADARGDRYDAEGFYRPGAFPSTGERMARYEREAPDLADAALGDLGRRLGHDWRQGVTHLVVTTCTGYAAPGLDGHLIARHGLASTVERTMIGFMGCNAALNAYKLARHIVRSDADARVLVLNLELCGLHFQESGRLETALMFLLFADGAAASIVSREPSGLKLDGFASDIAPGTEGQITWNVRDNGFDMWLSGQVPRIIARALPGHMDLLDRRFGKRPFDLFAVHPGGRTILDAAEIGLGIDELQLDVSRSVLRDYGNMSSATLPFVLARMMQDQGQARHGVALGFGPGLSIESMVFREAAA